MLAKRIFSAFFPVHCLNCNKEINYQKEFCREHLYFLNKFDFCNNCSPFESDNSCCNINYINLNFNHVARGQLNTYSLFPYQEPLSNLLWKYKYQDCVKLSKFFTELFFHAITSWKKLEILSEVDLLIPVPSSKPAIYKRGYSHMHLVACKLSKKLNIPYEAFALVRSKNATPQVDLGFSDRLVNLHNAFSANTLLCKDKNILLIDDVTTTGATISDCTRALFSVGAKKIYALTIMKTDDNFSDLH